MSISPKPATILSMLTLAACCLVAAAPRTPLEGGLGVVRGKVVNTDDKPQQDIVVKLMPPVVPGKAPGSDAAGAYNVKSDKDGAFKIEKVKPGSYRLLAGDKNTGMAVKEVSIAADQTVTLN